jgi:hypothetical protein
MLPMPATSKRTRLLEEVAGYHVQRKQARTLHIVSSVATVKTSTFEKCVITGAINYVKS